jgi:hypothetical protein
LYYFGLKCLDSLDMCTDIVHQGLKFELELLHFCHCQVKVLVCLPHGPHPSLLSSAGHPSSTTLGMETAILDKQMISSISGTERGEVSSGCSLDQLFGYDYVTPYLHLLILHILLI